MRRAGWVAAGGACAAMLAAGIWAFGTHSAAPEAASRAAAPQTDQSFQAAMDAIIPDSELSALRRRAQVGDNEAAERLGDYFSWHGQGPEGKRWYRLAAARGQCGSMSALMSLAYEERDRTEYDRQNENMRTHQCTAGRMLPPQALRDVNASTPMWDDQPELLWNGH